MKSSRILKKFGNIAYVFSVALVIAALLTNLVPPRTASAHHPELSGAVVCLDDGSYQITWTINNWSGTTLPMTITAISRSIGVSVGTSVQTSVQGSENLPGTTNADITLTVSGSWSNGATGTTTSDKIKLKGDCTVPTPPPPPDYQLNLSHIYCYEGDNPDLIGMVEIHFVLLNVPDGIIPGTLTYTYGSISPGAHTGNVWHYTDYVSSGTYNVQSASVDVGGVTVTLHNPGSYAGTYDCGTTENASASVSLGTCTYSPVAGSLTPVTITLTGASLTIAGTTYTSSTTIDLAPGNYPYTWTALPGYTGSGNGSVTVGDCTPGNAEASVYTEICTWTEEDGSLTPIVINLTGASLTIDGVTYSSSTTIYLPPGFYDYTWTALSGYIGSGSGQLYVGDCIPEDASASVSLGTCTWDELDGSMTPVTIDLTGASLTIDGVTYNSSTSIDLAPGNYPYTWTALEGYKGSGSGSITVSECIPEDASASISLGTCTWDELDGSMTPVTITLTGASLTIDGVTYTSSTSIDLAPGDYPYTWTALDGYKGSGDGTLVVGDCTPGNAVASISTGICTWDDKDGSMTPVTIDLTGASLTIDGVTYTSSTTIDLAPGNYPYTWTALTGYIGSGSGELVIEECIPAPVPTADLVCYTLEFSAFKLNVGNSGPTGEIGYSTDLDGTIVSLGSIANGGTTLLLVPGNATTLYLYPEDRHGGWGTPTEVGLDITLTAVCEKDPMGLVSFCSYVDLSQPHGWIVTNLNAFAVSFTWEYGTMSSGAPILLAAGTSTSFTTTDQPGEEMEIFVDGILLASTVAESCPEFITLGLVGICSDNPENTHGWRASNWNDFEVTAEWRVVGTSLTGLLTIPASSAVLFTTPIEEGDMAQLYYGGVFQDDAGAAQDCVPPEIPPETPPETPPVVIIPLTAADAPILIPVTGVADDLGSMVPVGFFSLGLGFFGLGTILHGVNRRRLIKV